MSQIISIDALDTWIGRDLGASDWLTIDQAGVNQFADATGDHQFIHVDPEAATPIFGGTIAHGFLTLSLCVSLMGEMMLEPEGHGQWINYGLNKVRFIAPVLTGSRVRLAMTCEDIAVKKPGVYLLTYTMTLEIEGSDKPAYVAEFLMMSVGASA